METVLLAGSLGIAGTVVGIVFQQIFSSREADRNFDRQRRLAAEDHARRVTEASNRDLSARLDLNLAYGQALRRAAHEVGIGFVRMANISERSERLNDLCIKYGITPGSPLVPANSLENDALRDLVQRHREVSVDLELMLVLDEGEDFKSSKLRQASNELDELGKEVDVRRRQLRREGNPL